VHSLAERLLAHIRRDDLFSAGERVGVAVSGGIDSVALLRLLLQLRHELGIVVSVVHFNHKLRAADSDADEEFVASLARAHDLEFYCDTADVAEYAAEEHSSVEAAARELRYGFFSELLGADLEDASGAEAPLHDALDRSAGAAPPKGKPQGLKPSSDGERERGPEGPLFHGADQAARLSVSVSKIATGHTLDDQAETVLMRVIRGAGLRGLRAIHPRIAIEDDDGDVCGEIVRPLLGIRRAELEQYLKDIGQSWREDESNGDEKFTRNRVRKLVLPLLEREFNPAVSENLAELAEIARGEEDYWENEVAGWHGTTIQWSEPEWAQDLHSAPSQGLVQIGGADSDLAYRVSRAECLVMNASVSRMWLLGEPLAVQRRLVKAIGEEARIPLEFKHVEEILRFASEDGPAGKELSLPLGWKVLRDAEELLFATPDLRMQPGAKPGTKKEPQNYEYKLKAPGSTAVPEAGFALEVRRVEAGAGGYNPDHLLNADLLTQSLWVRNWRPGDRFWPAHTKAPRKVKELLQERHVAHAERAVWPVVVSGEEIVWMRGCAVPAKLRAQPGRGAIWIGEAEDAALRG
jgi:tRNA(Ile)-lysidine synthase